MKKINYLIHEEIKGIFRMMNEQWKLLIEMIRMFRKKSIEKRNKEYTEGGIICIYMLKEVEIVVKRMDEIVKNFYDGKIKINIEEIIIYMKNEYKKIVKRIEGIIGNTAHLF
jgi:hypothetical protein